MTTSTDTFPESLRASVCRLYELSEIQTIEPIQTGVLSTNWKLTTSSGEFFLKQYRFPLEERIQEIHAVKHHYAQAGIPVILPIAHKEGGTYFAHEDSFFAVFPFIHAHTVERGNLSKTNIISMGETLARIYLAGRNFPVSVTTDTFRSWGSSTDKIDAYIAKIEAFPQKNDFDALALADLYQKKELIGRFPASFESLGLTSDHLSHGDYLEHNLFFTEDGAVSHVFDWEKTQYAPRAYELVRILMYTLLDLSFSEKSIQDARLFLSAYNSVYPVSNEELRAGIELFFLKILQNAWIQRECYDLGNMRPAQFLASDMQRISYLAEHRDELFDALIRP